jgi:predicted PurR-regulated permease PerM
MGPRVNLSPFVIILSLAVWGTVWGVAGLFLCVPLTMIVVIICAQVPATRPIAVLLSADGRID